MSLYLLLMYFHVTDIQIRDKVTVFEGGIEDFSHIYLKSWNNSEVAC